MATAAGRQVALLAGSLEGLDVLHLTSDLAPGRIEAEEHAGATVHRLGRAPRDEESLRLAFQVGKELGRELGCDLVHGFYAVHSGYLAVLIARALDRPSLVSLRGNDVDLGLFQGSRHGFLRSVLEQADQILGVSREILDTVRLATGRSHGLHFVPNGVDVGGFTPGTPSPEAIAELETRPRPWVGFCGELRFKKGLSVLCELAEALAEREAGTVVAIGGGRGDEREGLLRWRAAQPAASRRLIELPYRRDAERLTSLYRAMDLMVFPSLWDGMPNALLEAMACGRPVLAAAVGGITDVIVDGESGYLVQLRTLGEFATAVDRVLALSREDRERTGRMARERVASAFSLEAERQALLERYQAAKRETT